MSFFGFIFAAPGAVVIHGHTSPARMGKIAVAGPLVNYLLAIGFLLVAWINPVELLSLLFTYGAAINAFLGLFNMIPVAMFDGKKIIKWSKLNYGLMVAAGFLLSGISWMGLS